MTVTDTFTLSLAPAELTLIAQMLDVPSLFLTEDPFLGWLADEIEESLKQAKESLAARGYIEVRSDGTVAVDTGVAALVGALAFPDSSLVATVAIDGQPPLSRHLHFASGLIVEQEQHRNHTYSLTALRNQDAAVQRLKEFLCLDDQPALAVEPCTITEADVNRARQIACEKGSKACAGFLEHAGASPATAHSLAVALSRPVLQDALLALTWQGKEARQIGGFTLLQGADSMWLFRQLQRDAESWLEIAPCDGSYAIQQVEDLVRVVVPIAET